jgi:quinol monooxygenase YgiN
MHKSADLFSQSLLSFDKFFGENLMNKFKAFARPALIAASLLLWMQSTVAQIALKPSPNGEVTLVVNFEIKPGTEMEFEQAFRRSVTCSRLEPGNIAFNVHKVYGSERSYILYEIWRSEAAVNSHFAQPYTKALFAMFDRNLIRPLSESDLRFVIDLNPATRSAPAKTNPASRADCR